MSFLLRFEVFDWTMVTAINEQFAYSTELVASANFGEILRSKLVDQNGRRPIAEGCWIHVIAALGNRPSTSMLGVPIPNYDQASPMRSDVSPLGSVVHVPTVELDPHEYIECIVCIGEKGVLELLERHRFGGRLPTAFLLDVDGLRLSDDRLVWDLQRTPELPITHIQLEYSEQVAR